MNFTAWAKEQGLKPETREYEAADRAWQAAIGEVSFACYKYIERNRLTARAFTDIIGILLRD